MENPQKSWSQLSLSLFKNLLLLSTGSFSALLLVFSIHIGQTGQNIGIAIDTFFNPDKTTTQIEIPTLIVDRLKQTRELTTAVFVMDTIVPTAAERKLGTIVIAKTKLLYIARGEVKAGLDLSQLTTKDLIVSKETITINLPPPRILDSKVDVNLSKVYDYDRGFLNLGPDVAPQLQTLAQRQTLAKIVATACDRGLLQEANRRAKLAIFQLLLDTGSQKRIEVNSSPASIDNCLGENR